jgi:DNA polymerase-3 subunit epsilon
MNKILVLDIETTGFSPSKNFIVEIGIVSLDLDNGDREILFNQVLWEKGITAKEVSESWIVTKGYIKTDEIRNSKPLSSYHTEIQAIFDEYPLGATAYNRKFDNSFLKDRQFTYKELPCPMLLCVDVCKIPSPRGRGFKWPKVQEAYDIMFPKNKYTEIHRGADDAFHEAEIVYELYKQGLFKLN